MKGSSLLVVLAALFATAAANDECKDNSCFSLTEEILAAHGCSKDELDLWLSPELELPGYHPLCVARAAESDGTRNVLAFKEGSAKPLAGAVKEKQWGETRNAIAALVDIGRHYNAWDDIGGFAQLCRNEHERCVEWATRGECDLNPSYMHIGCAGSCGTCNKTNLVEPIWRGQSYGIFDSQGSNAPIDSLEAFRAGGLFLVFEGGQFIWPGVRLGFRRRVTLAAPNGTPPRQVVVETLALQPLVLEVADFLTPAECDHVINEAAPQMAQSKVALMDKDVGKADQEFRTSSTYFLPSQTATLRAVDDRVAALTRVPRQHQEYVQVLRYERGQYYGSHHDFWDPIFYQSDEWLAMSRGGFQNRLATVLWYMSDVPSGGETNFPRAHGGPDLPNTQENCGRRGLSVRPVKGKVVVFYSLRPDGSGDTFSLHSACPVQEGVKWAANKWVWNVNKGFIK